MTLEACSATVLESAPNIFKDLKTEDTSKSKNAFIGTVVTAWSKIDMKPQARIGGVSLSSVWPGLKLNPITIPAHKMVETVLRLSETKAGAEAVFVSLKALSQAETSRKSDQAFEAADDDLQLLTKFLLLKTAFGSWEQDEKVQGKLQLRSFLRENNVLATPSINYPGIDPSLLIAPLTQEAAGRVVPTPQCFVVEEGVPAPNTITRSIGKSKVSKTISTVLANGSHLQLDGTWLDRDGRVLFSPLLVGTECWNVPGTDYKIRLGQRFKELEVESPAPSSSTNSTSSTISSGSARADKQLEFVADSRFVRSVFTEEEIPKEIKVGQPLFQAAYKVAVEQWKMDFLCPYADILVQTIKHYLPAHYFAPEPVFETPAPKA